MITPRKPCCQQDFTNSNHLSEKTGLFVEFGQTDYFSGGTIFFDVAIHFRVSEVLLQHAFAPKSGYYVGIHQPSVTPPVLHKKVGL
jgi:hypothetical protein